MHDAGRINAAASAAFGEKDQHSLVILYTSGKEVLVIELVPAIQTAFG